MRRRTRWLPKGRSWPSPDATWHVGGARRPDCFAWTCAAGRPGRRSVQARRRRIPRCPGSRGIELYIDVLINNAAPEGVGSYAAAGDNEDSRELFETNYWSPFALARALLPSMLARGSGALVSVSSLGALPRFRVRGTTLRPRQPSRSRPRRFVPSYVARGYACSSCILASSILPCSVSSKLVPLSPPGCGGP